MDSLSHTPTPAKRSQTADTLAPTQRKPRDGAADAAGDAVSVGGFSQLLQAAGLPEAASNALQTVVQGTPAGEALDTAAQSLMGDAALANVLPDDAAWSLHSLVGQTAQLDQAADVMVRNGTHIQARVEAGESSSWVRNAAQTLRDAAAQVPVVAQGVAAVADGGTGQAVALASAGAAAWSLAGDAMQTLAEAATGSGDAEDGDALSRMDRSTEGRVALQGQWTTVDRQLPPAEAMQRLLGQMSQFLSATGATDAAGVRRANGKDAEAAESAVQDAATVSAGTGVGSGRLLDSAVAQAAASQQAGQAGAEQASAEPDMAFWMNARQQKAEVVLDRDGEPVRVQVTMEGNTAHVMFRSDEQATRAMLDASVAQLRDLLASQGVELAGVQVGAQGNDQAQSDASGAREAFMPEGARRVRLPSGGAVENASVAQRASGAPRSGVDVFA